jgi:hypothetical protein
MAHLLSSSTVLSQRQYVPDSVKAWLDDPRWWLRSPVYGNRDVRVGAHSLPEVVDALRVVYDEPTCRDLIDRGYWVPMAGLFIGEPFEWFGVMLALGADLVDAAAMAAPWLAGRLRAGGDQWLGARLELGAFAGLRRHLFSPDRADVAAHLPQWDFTLEVDGTTFTVECKTLSAGNDDGNFDHVEQRFQNFIVEFGMEPRCNATFDISNELRGLMHQLQVQPFHDRVMPELTDELQRALAASVVGGGSHLVGRFGTVTRTIATNDDGFLGHWIVAGYASTTFHRQRRSVNSFANATANFEHAPRGSHRVAVVWLGKDYLDCTSLAQLITKNLGTSLRDGDISVSVDASRFDYETGVALGATRPFTAPSWLHDRGVFHLGSSQSRNAYRIYDAVSAWSYHLNTRGG